LVSGSVAHSHFLVVSRRTESKVEDC